MAIINNWDLTTSANDTVGSSHLTNNGSVTFGADGATFNGTNQWLSGTLSCPSTFSLVALARFNWSTAISSPVAWAAANFGMMTGFYYQNNVARAYVMSNYLADAAGDYTSSNYPAATFVLITMTVSATNGTVKFYRNLNNIANGLVGAGSTATSFSIGRPGAKAGYYFSGNIKTVSLYAHELSLSEIAALAPGAAVSNYHQAMTGGM